MLKTLQQILNSDSILIKTANLTEKYKSPKSIKGIYSCPFDGEFFRNNTFLSKDCAISLHLYIDDFEICNPIGTQDLRYLLDFR